MSSSKPVIWTPNNEQPLVLNAGSLPAEIPEDLVPHKVKDEVMDHVLISLLGLVLIGSALLTAMVSQWAIDEEYFNEYMGWAAYLAEWAILLAGVITTIAISFRVAIESIKQAKVAWRGKTRRP
jgi:hypothetical protein